MFMFINLPYKFNGALYAAMMNSVNM